MKIFVALCLLLVWADAAPYEQLQYELLLEEFSVFKLQYGKVYAHPSEEAHRMKIYHENRMLIAKHNQQFHEGKVTYELGMNKFGDMLQHEVYATMFGIRNGTKANRTNMRKGSNWLPPTNVNLPKKIDWKAKGYVTPVKNQKKCGSCWAFSATGALEGQIYRKTGKLVSLSEQNLMDCSRKYGNNGCRGGLMAQAFEYIKDNKGLDTEESYPYEAQEGNCRFNPANIGGSDSGYFDIEQENEAALMQAVATVGPVAIGIDADHYSYVFYKSGVYYNPGCEDDTINHGVLAVGYAHDEESNMDYWLVKNSWGEEWGDNGYVKMAKDMDNNCCIACMASYPIV